LLDNDIPYKIIDQFTVTLESLIQEITHV